MSIKSITENQVDFRLQRVNSELQNVPLIKLFDQRDIFAFRDDQELEAEDLKPLAEDIAACGINTPLLVQDRGDQGFLALDGHRRLYALRSLVERCVEGFDSDMDVPANVVSSAASPLDITARAISANVQRQALSAEGRIRAAARLAQLAMPQTDIARCLGVSEATVTRDLALAGNERLMTHIRHHHIAATAAATLMKAALDAD